MSTAQPEAAIQEELRLVEEDLARVGQAAGLGDADFDQAGVIAGGPVIGAGWKFPGVAPGCRLPGGAGGRVAAR